MTLVELLAMHAYQRGSQQTQEVIERRIGGSIEQTLGVLLEFLTRMEGEANLVLLSLKVWRWPQTHWGREAETADGLLEALLMGAEQGMARFVEHTADALELLRGGKLGISQYRCHTKSVQQNSGATPVTPTHVLNGAGKLPGAIYPRREASEQPQQRLTILWRLLPDPQGRFEWQSLSHHSGL
jgi:hypothetical protein